MRLSRRVIPIPNLFPIVLSILSLLHSAASLQLQLLYHCRFAFVLRLRVFELRQGSSRAPDNQEEERRGGENTEEAGKAEEAQQQIELESEPNEAKVSTKNGTKAHAQAKADSEAEDWEDDYDCDDDQMNLEGFDGDEGDAAIWENDYDREPD
eukprot:CAMPEP_0119321028 /NCGR_PEP_ID=MMETSP1333-20130426/54191_1 /TAXON_ID=418940 /ORGANISM="Scyphosphaera apsteinii, Strain RCC1455" /LENGTH=152 /DNA_ID=CAMNT_0007327889 /DNA_START=131 /DNA_END=589 /DNA_ORIENTATION=+